MEINTLLISVNIGLFIMIPIMIFLVMYTSYASKLSRSKQFGKKITKSGKVTKNILIIGILLFVISISVGLTTANFISKYNDSKEIENNKPVKENILKNIDSLNSMIDNSPYENNNELIRIKNELEDTLNTIADAERRANFIPIIPTGHY